MDTITRPRKRRGPLDSPGKDARSERVERYVSTLTRYLAEEPVTRAEARSAVQQLAWEVGGMELHVLDVLGAHYTPEEAEVLFAQLHEKGTAAAEAAWARAAESGCSRTARRAVQWRELTEQAQAKLDSGGIRGLLARTLRFAR